MVASRAQTLSFRCKLKGEILPGMVKFAFLPIKSSLADKEGGGDDPRFSKY